MSQSTNPKGVEETNNSMKFDVDQGSITQVQKSTFETQLLVREFPNNFQSAKSTDTMATWAKIMPPNLPPMQKDIHDSLRACKAELEPSLESVSIVQTLRRNFGSAGPGFLLVHEKILGGSERMWLWKGKKYLPVCLSILHVICCIYGKCKKQGFALYWLFIQVDVPSGSASFLPKMTGWSTVSRISAVEHKSLWIQQSYSQSNTHIQKVDNATICTCTQKYENSILSSLSNICFGLWDPLESHSSDTQNPPHGCRSGRSVNGGMWMWVVKWVRFRMVRCGAW